MIDQELIHLLESDELLGKAVIEAWQSINETKMSRIYQAIKGKPAYAMLTAFRKDYDYNTNTDRNDELKSLLAQKGLSHKRVTGEWIETDKGPVQEQSLLVVKPEDWDEKEFRDLMVELAGKFDQDAITYKPTDSDRVMFLEPSNYTGELEEEPFTLASKLGPKSPLGSTGEFKTKGMKGTKPERQFSFPM